MESCPTIGIDLGTSYCRVAVWRNNWVDVIADELGNRSIPSYVAFTDSGRLIGDAARSQAAMNPTNTVYDVKRLIGRHTSDHCVENDLMLWPFKITESPNKKPVIVLQYGGEDKHFAPEEIAAMLLMKLRDIAEADLGSKVKHAVVSVPAKFNSIHRQAIKDAALIAGFHSARLINESSSAVISYCLDKKNDSVGKPINVLVFNLGGGMLDVSMFCIEEGVIETMASVGDTHLGGEDFSNCLVDYFVDNFKRKYNKDISGNPRKMRKLRTACEKAKRALSSASQTTIEIDFLFEDTDFFANISRAKFEEINMTLFTRCIEAIEKCLRESTVDKSEVDEIVLVGGSTRMPKLRQLLKDFFDGKGLCKSINPDEAVACGAAVYAANLNGVNDARVQDLLLLGITSYSIGIETAGGVMNVLIPKNTNIPTKKEQLFTTCLSNSDERYMELIPLNGFEATGTKSSYISKERNKSSDIKIRVYEGEMGKTMGNNLLEQIELKSFSPGPSGRPEIMVTFDIDGSGILSVSVKDMITGHENKMVIFDAKMRSSAFDIRQMVQQAEKFRSVDEETKKTVESKNALENYAYGIRNSMKIIKDEVEKTITWMETNQSAQAEKFDDRLKELKSMCNRLINNI